MNLEELEKLNRLKTESISTQERFHAHRQRILNSGAKVQNLSLFYYFKNCIFEKYMTFNGRARRKEYWGYNLYYFISSILVSILAFILKSPTLNGLFALCLCLPSLSVTVRRLHDKNISGRWLFAPIVFLSAFMILGSAITYLSANATVVRSFRSMVLFCVGFLLPIFYIVIFIFTCLKSDMNENKYGPIPHGVK